MKHIFLIIVLLFTCQSFAQSKDDKQLDFQVDPFDRTRSHTPEYAKYYFRTGYSVGGVGAEKGNFVLGAVGVRRYADEFYYGLEYASRYGLDGLKINALTLNTGHHFLTLRHRIKPYVGGYFGYTTLSDSSETLQRPSANGVNVGLDVGFEIWSLGFLSINQGLRLDYSFLNKKEYNSVNFQELYLMVNFRF